MLSQFWWKRQKFQNSDVLSRHQRLESLQRASPQWRCLPAPRAPQWRCLRMALFFLREGPRTALEALDVLHRMENYPREFATPAALARAARSPGGVDGLLAYISGHAMDLRFAVEAHPRLRLVLLAHDLSDESDEEEDAEYVRPSWMSFDWDDEIEAGRRCPWSVADVVIPQRVLAAVAEAGGSAILDG